MSNNNQSRSFIANNTHQQNINMYQDLNNFNSNKINLNNNTNNNKVPNQQTDSRTFANIGAFQKPTYNKLSYADELKQQMEEAKAKKEK